MAYCYFNGSCVEEEEASLPIHTLGVQRGYGVFDLLRARVTRLTFLEDHLIRFENSQRFLNLSRLVSSEEIIKAVEVLQDKNQFQNSTFKLMLLATGKESDEKLEPLLYIINAQLDVKALPKTGTLITQEYVREYPKIKSINYFTSNLLHQKKRIAGAIDVLYHQHGIISEASRSNIFVVKKNKISTPEKNILEGITRKHILKIAQQDFAVEVRDISMDDLMNADEIFISSTLKEVMPITKIDDQGIGDGGTGSVTAELLQRFHQYLENLGFPS